MRCDRNGVLTTILSASVATTLSPFYYPHVIETDPVTGQHLVGDLAGHVFFVPSAGGSYTTLWQVPATYGQAIEDARFAQDGTLWFTAVWGPTGPMLVRFDPKHKQVIKTVGVPSTYSRAFLRGLAIYGSRRLVCHQQSKKVTVKLKSQRPGDRGMPYVLACSFNRRPPPPWPTLQPLGGEYLFLDYTDWLFFLTANNLLPGILQNFQGQLDAQGKNVSPIAVNIPASLPPLNMTVFVAGVILNPAGVTVTNTHWFVL
jgi:hypothetical protein